MADTAPEQAQQGPQGAARDAGKAATSKVSDIVRALALSVIAVSWVWAGGLAPKDASASVVLDEMKDSCSLSLAVFFALVTMVLDLLQYVSQAWMWGRLAWSFDQLSVAKIDHLSGWRFWASWRFLWRVGVVRAALGRMQSAPAVEPAWNPNADCGKAQDEFRSLDDKERRNFVETYLTPSRPPRLVRPSVVLFWAKVVTIICSVAFVGWFGLH